MKKHILLITIILFVFTNRIAAVQLKPITQTVNGITLTIDPWIELFNIVAMQAGLNDINTANISYKKECLDYFEPYKNLEAPSILMSYFQNGWGIDDPIFFLLYLDENFEINKNLPSGIIERAGGLEKIKQLATALKNYAQKSDFKTFFYKNQEGFYEHILHNTAYHFKDFEAISIMENYFGQKLDGYNLVLNINGGYGNFGRKIISNGKEEMYAVISSRSYSGNLSEFPLSVSTIELIFHEFGHGFINPAIDQLKSEVGQFQHLQEPIRQSMQQQAYHNWHTIVCEHVVRASVIRLTDIAFGTNYSKDIFYKLMIGNRFIYGDLIINKLKDYENNRLQYPTFADFAPELIRAFEQVDEEYINEKQQLVKHTRSYGIDEIKKPNRVALDSTTLFIIGTHEKDTIAEQKMHSFVKLYRDMFSTEIRIITDEEALARDLKNNDLVVFGTPEGNLFLKKHLEEIPVKIYDDHIITNKLIRGNDLQLVMSWVNPYNQNKNLTIYTGQRTENIKNFHYTRHKDQSHYWVAQDLITLDQGNYNQYISVGWFPDITE
ncbi:DUF4932 domain-containing protein [Mangrovivirga sp. M17]|uniref:DUF4932 domain-containing protein n=1 Tax=Mangrovivirga halotolerans TaxID=2993936 RepID=A0ABT3RP94_9BACT|nr:DUF4932 domain-containing protein [Mangrovivirga halotolerans]MCX2743358.1 DUF4932 domain-containing protein [Mangrovivirga halotolerans]